MIAPEQGKSKKLRVTTTVPIACDFGGKTCELSVDVGQTSDQAFFDFCSLKFQPGQAGQTKELEVTAKRDFVDDGDTTMSLKVHIPFNIDLNDWNNYIPIPDIKVRWRNQILFFLIL